MSSNPPLFEDEEEFSRQWTGFLNQNAPKVLDGLQIYNMELEGLDGSLKELLDATDLSERDKAGIILKFHSVVGESFHQLLEHMRETILSHLNIKEIGSLTYEDDCGIEEPRWTERTHRVNSTEELSRIQKVPISTEG